MSNLNISEEYINQNPFEGFMFLWKQIESALRDVYGQMSEYPNFSVLRAIRYIQDNELRNNLNQLRIWRNNLVHSGVDTREIPEQIHLAKLLLNDLRNYLNSSTNDNQRN